MGKTKTVKKIVVKKSNANSRLDIFVSKKLKLSRSQIQKMIEQKQVLLNDALPKKAGEQIKEGDVIVIARSDVGATRSRDVAADQSPDLRITETKGIATPRSTRLAMTPTIIAETPDYNVVEKPTGMLTHPTQANEKNTLVNFLVKKYPEIRYKKGSSKN